MLHLPREIVAREIYRRVCLSGLPWLQFSIFSLRSLQYATVGVGAFPKHKEVRVMVAPLPPLIRWSMLCATATPHSSTRAASDSVTMSVMNSE
jgi:hypothetical protein